MNWAIFSIYLSQGLLLGLQGGFSPGPFTTVVLSESLAHGRKAGMKCATAPLFSDPPVVLLSLFILDKISGTNTILGSISLIGAILLTWIAYKCFHVRADQFENPTKIALPLAKVVAVNFFNPNLYIYWMTILSPLCIKAARKHGIGYAVVFVMMFYIAMLSSKMTLAFIAGGARHRINGKWLVVANRFFGVVMFFFVAYFAYSGINMLCGGETNLLSH